MLKAKGGGIIETESFFEGMVSYFPNLKKRLILAHYDMSPRMFLKSATVQGVIFGSLLTIFAAFMLLQSATTLLFLIPLFVLFFYFGFSLKFLQLRAAIIKRRNSIDKEVVFAARYMLLRLYSGRPLLNALIDQSKSRGVAAEYVQEIVDDVNSGSTLEASLAKAIDYTPSEKFRRVLFHISNALKYGSDVTRPLELAINEIVEQQHIEIKKYGKKMNSLILFYMLVGIVVPSLGITVFFIVAGLLSISLTNPSLVFFSIVIFILQVLFLALVKGIRPSFEL